jgi:hypothetical protein
MSKKRKTETLVSAEASLARARSKLAKAEALKKRSMGIVIEKGSMTITSILYGAFEHKVPPTIVKVPTKIWGGTIAWGLAAFVPIHWLSAIFEGIGDSLMATYDYKAAMQVRTKTPNPFIAGDETEEELLET